LFTWGTPKPDFGIAKLFDVQVSCPHWHQYGSTPVYMAPEQWSGKTTLHPMCMIGGCFYELLTGKPPYQSDTPAGLFSQILTHLAGCAQL
jgi:serine/threonine protein kinase